MGLEAAGVGFPPEMYQPLLKAISPQAIGRPRVFLCWIFQDGEDDLLKHLQGKPMVLQPSKGNAYTEYGCFQK